MKVLVTGATGFIGSHLVDHLLERGDGVRALVRPGSKTQRLKQQDVHLVLGDLSDKEALNAAVDGIEVVYHAAALLGKEGDEAIIETNLKGTENLLAACARQAVKRFVFISSVAVYAPSIAKLVDEDSPHGGVGAYAQSKSAAEKIVYRYAQINEITCTILRPCRIYGERDNNYTERLLRNMLYRPVILVGSGGWPYYNLVHVYDVAAAAVLAGTHPQAAGQAFNITDGRGALLREIAETVQYISERRRPILSVPKQLVEYAYQIHAFRRISQVLSRQANYHPQWQQLFHGQVFGIAKVQRKLGYEPKINLQEGLHRALTWYEQQRG